MSVHVVDNDDSRGQPDPANQTRPSLSTQLEPLLMRSNSLPIQHYLGFEQDNNASSSVEQQSSTIRDPGSPHWRRERLLRIGTFGRGATVPDPPLNNSAPPTTDIDDTTSLIPSRSRTYGSISSHHGRLLYPRSRALSNESRFRYSPPTSPTSRLLKRASFLRKPTEYDAAAQVDSPKEMGMNNPNGIRVW